MIAVSSRCRKNAAKVPALPRIQAAMPFAYGAMRACSSPAPSAAMACHSAASLGPISGSPSTQPGGGGTPARASVFSPSPKSSACAMMVSTASASGTITTSNSTVVITITARPRFPHNRFCAARISGHVATTIRVAQIKAGRNGCRTHRLAMIAAAMNSTESRMRGSSRRFGRFVIAPAWTALSRRTRPLRVGTRRSARGHFIVWMMRPLSGCTGRAFSGWMLANAAIWPSAIFSGVFRTNQVGELNHGGRWNQWTIAASIAFSRVSSSIGLHRYDFAPPPRERDRDSGVSWPVMTTTGTQGWARASRAWTSNPLMSAMCRSSTTQSGWWSSAERRNSAPDPKDSTDNPAEPIRRSRALRTNASSSTTAIKGGFFDTASRYRIGCARPIGPWSNTAGGPLVLVSFRARRAHLFPYRARRIYEIDLQEVWNRRSRRAGGGAHAAFHGDGAEPGEHPRVHPADHLLSLLELQRAGRIESRLGRGPVGGIRDHVQPQQSPPVGRHVHLEYPEL